MTAKRIARGIRFSRSEWALIRRAAKISRATASEYLRESGLARARADLGAVPISHSSPLAAYAAALDDALKS